MSRMASCSFLESSPSLLIQRNLGHWLHFAFPSKCMFSTTARAKRCPLFNSPSTVRHACRLPLNL